ncbi:hypothetical protein PR001_g14710 [Phytophthora rubi]|uniref:Tc1-like transposase DDE domain-containing protein n=1 Tax=Phytophthora rubi TaxID=129364 RepID=A0A6A3L9Z3_9STRA|nr:hypothetical protein PR001_g14710 [Phytophthora rubi]
MAPVHHKHSHDIHCLCVSKWKQGYSYTKISKLLEIARSSVGDIIVHFKKHGHCVVAPRRGRPRITGVRDDRRIVGATETNRFVSAAVLADEVPKEAGHPVSPQFVRNRINAARLTGRSARKKPYLSKKHRKQRLIYSRRLISMQKEDWGSVLLTDDVSVELYGRTGRCLLQPTNFVQDNAPAHSAKAAKKLATSLQLNDLRHPPQSPDLNPIDNVCVITKRELNQNPASSIENLKVTQLDIWTSIENLKVTLLDIWTSIDEEVIPKCVMSMPARLNTVIANRAGHTKY